jgi:hypothetical protein
MPPAQYPDVKQVDFSGGAPESTLSETLKLPALATEPSATENKTAVEITPPWSQEPPKTEKEDVTDNHDDETESEKPDIVSSDGQEPPTFGRLETLRLESMGISSFAPILETAGTSYARMSFSLLPDPVEGGLETFASLSIKGTPPRQSPVTELAQELPSKQQSPGGLLEDSEDEDESGATNPPNKTADWEKMRAVFDLQQHEKVTAPRDSSAPVPSVPLDVDISSGAMSTVSAFSARDTHDKNSAPVPASPTGSADNLSEREKLEMEYLNRGVSLACQDFGMHQAT